MCVVRLTCSFADCYKTITNFNAVHALRKNPVPVRVAIPKSDACTRGYQ